MTDQKAKKKSKAFDIMKLNPKDVAIGKEVVVFQRDPKIDNISDWEFVIITRLSRYIHAKYKGQDKTFWRETGIGTGEDKNLRMVSLGDSTARRIVAPRPKAKKDTPPPEPRLEPFPINEELLNPAHPVEPDQEIGCDGGTGSTRSREETILAGALILLEMGPLSIIQALGWRTCLRIATEYAAKRLDSTKRDDSSDNAHEM